MKEKWAVPVLRCPRCGEATETDRGGRFCGGCEGALLPLSRPDAFRGREGWLSRQAGGRAALPGAADRDDEDYPCPRAAAAFLRKSGRSEKQEAAGRKMANLLRCLAALQLVWGTVGVVLLGVVGAERTGLVELRVMVGVGVAGYVVLFLLGAWARHMPVTAGAVGSVVWLGLVPLDVLVAPETAAHWVVLFVRLIGVFVLIRGLGTASRAT